MAYTVTVTSQPGCFVRLPSAALPSPAAAADAAPVAFSVRTRDGRLLYAACRAGGGGAPPGSLLLHRRLATALRLRPGEGVCVAPLHPPPAPCRRARLRADSQADYELLAISSARLQRSLLDTVGVVWPGARLPVWLDSRNVVTVTVSDVQPTRCCRLADMTELEIVPPDGATAADATPSASAEETDVEFTVSDVGRALGLQSAAAAPPPATLALPQWSVRALSGPPVSDHSVAASFLANRVCVCSPEDIPAGGAGWCEMTPVSSGDSEPCSPSALVYVVTVDTACSQLRAALQAAEFPSWCQPGAALVPQPALRQLRLPVGERVRLRRVKLPAAASVAEVTLVRRGAELPASAVETVRHALADWRACCADDGPWWSSGTLLRLTDDHRQCAFDVVVEGGAPRELFEVASPLAAEVVVSDVSSVYGPDARPWPDDYQAVDQSESPRLPAEFTSYGEEEANVVNWCRRAFRHPGAGHVLLSGVSGVGKTTLARQICRRLAAPPLRAFTDVLDCSCLLGKKPDAVLEHVSRLLDAAERRRPALLVLDSLDALLPAADVSDQPSQRAAYFAQLAAALRRRLAELSERRCAVLVLAVAGAAGLHAQLRRPRRAHVFGLEVTLAALDVDGRARQLRELCGPRAQLTDDCWRRLAERCRNCVARDLRTLVTRAAAAQAAAGAGTPPAITADCLQRALQDFQPASLALPPTARRSVDWQQVGGLEATRAALAAALLRPLRYGRLVARAGCRLLPRALLYGAPGTGKTLLARALADNSQVNFFVVKGPELLSKYIGASEQAVRDLFEKAARASPAVIFFDEFESLAPRRGHDSTGVTDRVVNQLLTLLDGAEEAPAGGRQVALLAATSRPDLLDPALLRPGRISHLLRCRLPTAAERGAILTALTRQLSVADDVDWRQVARDAPGLTGADLSALVTDAQLRAVRETLSAAQLTATSAAAAGPDVAAAAQLTATSAAAAGPNVAAAAQLTTTSAAAAGPDVAAAAPLTLLAGPPLDKHDVRVARQHPLLAAGCRTEPGGSASASAAAVAPLLARRHVEAALRELRPSLSGADRARYQALYDRFERERGGGPPAAGAAHHSAPPQQRVTLA